MKKTLPMLSVISAFCCALAILFEIFPVIVENDFVLAIVIMYISGFIACITLALWLIVGKSKNKIIIALVLSVISEAYILTGGFVGLVPYNYTICCVALTVPMISNILAVVHSEKQLNLAN